MIIFAKHFLVKNWVHVLLAGSYICAFVIGGASREALGLQMILYAYCWVSAAFILMLRGRELIDTLPKPPFVMLFGLILWCIVTIIPFPADWVSGNVIRDNRVAERTALGLSTNWLTLSATPLETVRSCLAFGPGVFAICCVSLMTEGCRQRIVYGILLLGVVSILLGIAQVFQGQNSVLYFWDRTNRGSSVGIFANANHQTIFAAILIPLVIAQASRYRKKFRNGDLGLGLALLFFGIFIIILLGVVAGGSLAGYGLAIFASLLSLFIWGPSRKVSQRRSRIVIASLVTVSVLLIALVYTSPQLSGLGLTELGKSELSRLSTIERSFGILRDNFVFGTGFGSFPHVFPFYEDAQKVTLVFMNHAHNDWLEWVLELGLPGMVLLGTFSGWLSFRYLKLALRRDTNSGDRLCKAAAICVCVLALHSVVDYPLRTPFLALIFSTLLGLSFANSNNGQEPSSNDEPSSPRHVIL